MGSSNSSSSSKQQQQQQRRVRRGTDVGRTPNCSKSTHTHTPCQQTYSGAGRELLVPELRGDREEVLALAAVVTAHDGGVVEAPLGGAGLGRIERRAVRGLRLVHAGEERDRLGGGRAVEGAEGGELPVAVGLLDARTGDGAHGRVEKPGDGGVLAEVVVQLDEVARAKLLASGSFGTEAGEA